MFIAAAGGTILRASKNAYTTEIFLASAAEVALYPELVAGTHYKVWVRQTDGKTKGGNDIKK